jgi:type IV secretion system protein VirB9
MRLALAFLLCTTVSAYALDAPMPGKEDAHIRTVPYSAMNRTKIIATVGRITTITFSPQEQIERVLFGQPDAPIQGPDPKEVGQQAMINNLPLIGKRVGKTDVVVITKLMPEGQERTYQIFADVHSTKDGDDDPDATYGLVYTYPQQVQQAKVEQQQAAVMTWKQKQEEKKKQVAEARLATDIYYGDHNWRYEAQGKDKQIAPAEAFDNGRLTGLRFPGNTELPTVYIVDPSGTEHTAQTWAWNDLVVVQQVAEHMRLRLGPAVLEVWNRAYDPVGNNPGTGTTSPTVVRQVVSTK